MYLDNIKKSIDEVKAFIAEADKLKVALGVNVTGVTLESIESISLDDHMFVIGKNYFIRTVTMIITGRLEKVGHSELLLSSAAWIADTGRLFDNLKSCEFNEIEPFPNDVIIGRGSIVDATRIDSLPTEQI